jgi:RNA-binding protein YlmH
LGSNRHCDLFKTLQIPESCHEGLLSVLDAINRCEQTFESQFTHFLDPLTVRYIDRLKGQTDCRFMVYGGYEQAEFCMLGIFPAHEEPLESSFPIDLLAFKYPKQFGVLEHKDVLGALMSLGLERKVFGDLLLVDSYVQFFTKSSLTDYLIANLEKVKRTGVLLEHVSKDFVKVPVEERIQLNFSVASLRLDAVVSGAFNVSRSTASQAITKGLVKCNYAVEERIDYTVSQGDMLSLRRHGRFFVGEVLGQSKKGKLRLSGHRIK